MEKMDELMLRNIMGYLKEKDYKNFTATSWKYREEFYEKYMIEIRLMTISSKNNNDNCVSLKKIIHLHIDGYYSYVSERNTMQNLINEAKKLRTLFLVGIDFDGVENFEHLETLKYHGLQNINLQKLPQSLKYLRLNWKFNEPPSFSKILFPNLEILSVHQKYEYMDGLTKILKKEYGILYTIDAEMDMKEFYLENKN